MLRWASWWAQAAYGRVRHCPGSLVPAIGSRPPENAAPKSTSPPENSAASKPIWPPENLAKRNSTWPPENSTWLKDTWAPENSVPAQETITRDNVTLKVDAVVYYRVVDPLKAIINVQNYHFVVSQVAQTSLRSVTGRSNMDQLLSEREQVNAELKDVIDAPTEGPWGVRVERVEVKDISLPESMKRSMSRQAEAERERRARIIAADGEYQASKKLAEAATVMAADPAALQLRLLQTVIEVAAEKNSTLVMPFPVELLRFFDRAALGTTSPEPASAAADDAAGPAVPPALPAATVPSAQPAGVAQAVPLNGSSKADTTG
jgi:hypothetical protein